MKLKNKLFSLLLLISYVSIGQTGFGKHYFAGAIISAATSTAVYKYTNKPLVSSTIGSIVGSGAGVVKEVVWDRGMKKGHYSTDDMAGTICGSLYVIIPFQIFVNECKSIDTTKYNFKLDTLKN